MEAEISIRSITVKNLNVAFWVQFYLYSSRAKLFNRRSQSRTVFCINLLI
uniref:Uncharacterized protein n=1 Tax=Phakopsora pachyrhizi TaxID=170000 RepID=A0A0S1MKN1_PHAPC